MLRLLVYRLGERTLQQARAFGGCTSLDRRLQIVESEIGFLCTPSDPADLARASETYFESDLFKDLNNRRQKIREHACERHSWNVVGEMTQKVYAEL
jgi:glycosyltransferase involved in cell wall biosynthesis